MARILAFTVLAALALTATPQGGSAAEVARLRQNVRVTGDFVRIGDLVENAGNVADVAVFRSPDAGVTGTVSAKQVLDAIRRHDILIVDTAGINDITVTRSARELAVRDVVRKIAEALSERFRLADESLLDISFDREPRALYVDPQAADTWQIERAAFDPRSGRFDIVFAIPGSISTGQGSYRYLGYVTEMAECAVTVRGVRRGDIIAADDVIIERRKRSDVPADAVTTIPDVSGFAARQSLRAGQPLRRADLAKPEIVKRDELVTLFYEVPGIMLTVRGKALSNGAAGDAINVLNIQSKRTVQGTVDGPGRVIVTATTPIIVTQNAGPVSAGQSK